MIARACRRFAGTLAAAALLAGQSAALAAQAEPQGAPSAAGYQPQGADERGLWMEMEEAERELRTSKFVVRDPALNAYVRGVLCRTVGQDRCQGVRIYIVRTAQFNANMAPNGMMQVWTGLLLRMRNEAQLAAVLGHEFGHFDNRHSLKIFREVRAKTDAMAWLSFLPYGVGLLAQLGTLGSIFSFNREMEQEADIVSIDYLKTGGYAPQQASLVWAQFRDEQDATAAERKVKSRKDKNGGFFASHPNTGERMAYLAKLSDAAPTTGDARELEYRAALADWWAPFIDDQIKLNDFGATEFLLNRLAASGWTTELFYARAELYRTRGNDGDFEKAAEFYRAAITAGSPLPEARRGLGLALLRTGAPIEGRTALQEYLRMKPDAGDRAMMAMLAGGV
ncbi:tetratricopeptide (TPR) repeat protein [Sphingomonas zeicaulis]|uniref:M48 family metalloprotease n=1 Tax=Sphingomonas zeicaulis TaxID=1632740 RepID=UPI003D20D7D6